MFGGEFHCEVSRQAGLGTGVERPAFGRGIAHVFDGERVVSESHPDPRVVNPVDVAGNDEDVVLAVGEYCSVGSAIIGPLVEPSHRSDFRCSGWFLLPGWFFGFSDLVCRGGGCVLGSGHEKVVWAPDEVADADAGRDKDEAADGGLYMGLVHGRGCFRAGALNA